MWLGGGDPGKHHDAWAEVITEIPDDLSELRVKAAKRWTTPPGSSVSGMGPFYLLVEQAIRDQHLKKPFDKFILEINNTGTHVYEELRFRHSVPVLPVTTIRQMIDLKKKHDWERMDKNETVGVAVRWNMAGVLKFPKVLTAELAELQRQLSIFAEIKTGDTGNISYRAQGSEHDDLVMALLLNVHYARRFLRGLGIVSVSPRDVDALERANLPPSSIRVVDG